MSVLRVLLLVVAAASFSLRAQTSVPTIGRVIPAQALAPGSAVGTVNLAEYFSVPGVNGQVALFDTVLGKFGVELRADAAPRHVANFLSYVQAGSYTNSFFHRSSSLETNGAISIVQGGGFTMTSGGAASIATQAPVALEYSLPNERGTLAAARTSDINSATSQWYFNVRDNTTILGPGNGGGYTVFGRVIGSGMSVVDAIAALPRVNAGSPFTELPVRNYSSGDIQSANLVIVNSIRQVPLFADASGSGWVTFTAQSSNSGVVSTSLNGSVLTLTPVGSGNATVTVRATDANGNSVDTSFAVTVAAVAPSFTVQPAAQTTIATGNTAVLSATVAGATTYQWQRNGADIPGATNASIVISNASSANAGTYTLNARNSVGITPSNSATISVVNVSPADVGRLVNLSIRSNAGTSDQTLIVGFNLGGFGTSGTAPLLLRGVGPSLAQYGVTGVLADPIATLYSGTTVVASNNNWGGDALVDARAKQVGAFAFTSNSSLDAALPVSPAAGSYTMQVTGNGNTTGAALAEIYDAYDNSTFIASSPRLINVSARTQVGTGQNVLIAGFVIRGATAKTVLIRATGPALIPFGVAGTLANPKLDLFKIGATGAATLMATNDDWGGDPQISAGANVVGAFPLTNGASKDAAMLVTLSPGNYTAQVSGADGGTGVALVEVYEVP